MIDYQKEVDQLIALLNQHPGKYLVVDLDTMEVLAIADDGTTIEEQARDIKSDRTHACLTVIHESILR